MTIKPHLRGICSQLWNFCIDTIAPQDPFIQEIEKMSAAEFISKAKPVESDTLSPDILSFFTYRDPLVKAAILEVKSYGNKKIALLLGKVVYELLLAELEDLASFNNFTSPMILPIPLTKKSLRKRGWNQCALFVDAIGNADSQKSLKIIHNLLIKTKETGDQVGKGRRERFENLREVFSVSDSRIVEGRNIIVLDDITTTGATLHEAKRALESAGAKNVLCIAIAH